MSLMNKNKLVWACSLSLAAAGSAYGASTPFECLMEPSQVVEIRPPVEGLVERVHVNRGDFIRRGQVLVELLSNVERSTVEAARYRAQMDGPLKSARNRLAYADKKLARTAGLAKENYASVQTKDEAEAERAIAESDLQAATEQKELARLEHKRATDALALRTVTAPFNGVVMDRQLNPGDVADASGGRKPVLKVAQIDPLRVDIVLPASLIGKVKAGSKAQISAVGVPNKLAATVKMVDRVVDAASDTFVARLELPNPQAAIPGGVKCKAELDGVDNPSPMARPAKPAL